MKRSVAILTTLLTPGVVFVALAMGCVLMSHGVCESHDCCEGQTMLSAPCCPDFQAAQAGASLHASQFTLAAPEATAIGVEVATPTFSAMAGVTSKPLDSSPPVLTLRL
jgi:hypothetical protein